MGNKTDVCILSLGFGSFFITSTTSFMTKLALGIDIISTKISYNIRYVFISNHYLKLCFGANVQVLKQLVKVN